MSRLNRLGRTDRNVLYYDRWNGQPLIDFLGQPDVDAPSPETIHEADLVRIATGNRGIREALSEALGLGANVWMLVGEQRARVFPADKHGKPGDFDIIVGELRDDGVPSFAQLALVEVKRSPVHPEGRRKSRPSGLGTTQARGASKLGFDLVLLMHFVLGPDESIRTPVDKATLPEHADAVHAVVRDVRRADDSGIRRPYGLMVVEWARGRGARLEHTGALAFTLGFPAHRLRVDAHQRRLLEAHLRLLLPARACPGLLFVCGRCGTTSCECG